MKNTLEKQTTMNSELELEVKTRLKYAQGLRKSVLETKSTTPEDLFIMANLYESVSDAYRKHNLALKNCGNDKDDKSFMLKTIYDEKSDLYKDFARKLNKLLIKEGEMV